jgi:glycosyltransferase involved in cell wall biosynthesis
VTRVLLPLGEPLLPGKARFVAIVNTAMALARAGADVKLLLPGPPAAVSRYVVDDLGGTMPPGLEVVRIGGWHRALGHPFTWNGLLIASACRAVRRLATDARVIAHVRHEKLAAALVEHPVPVVFEAHAIAADYERERGRPARRVDEADRRTRSILARAAGLAAITQGLLDALVARYGFKGPTAVARSGIDLDRFPRLWPAGAVARRAGPPVIVYVGRLGGWKAVPVLIRAVGSVPGARLLLVGGGDAEEAPRLREVAREAGVADRVEITARVPHRAIAAKLADASVAVHVLPQDLGIATRDTSPLKLVEYLAAGIPVVASDVPAVREIVTDGVSAVLAPAGDSAALGAAICRVLEDPALQERLSIEGRAVAERHSWDARAHILRALHERARLACGGAS